MDPEEESPGIGPEHRTRLVAGMVFTLKATITVPGVGRLRTERIVHLAETGGRSPRHVSDASLLADGRRLALPLDATEGA
jgi:Xaa-Pro aminopeptidase